MKPDGPGQRGAGKGAKKPAFGGSPLRSIPMEWMDPMSWRLPSGKALAEFALQAGFLAPLMLSGSTRINRAKKSTTVKSPVAPSATNPENSVVGSQVAIRSQVGEEPDHSGTFRESGGFRQDGFREGGFREGGFREGGFREGR
jgi:hypothetical protein